MLKTITLLRTHVSRVNPVSARAQIFEWIRQKTRSYVCVAPVSTLVDARRDPLYAHAVNQAGMVTPDGMPVVWLARAQGCSEVARTYGPDLLLAVCNEGQALGLRHFFYGATEETLRRLESKLLSLFPKMIIAGRYAPAFAPQAQWEEPKVIDQINNAHADIVWVGLGSPKQDFWMQRHRPLLNASVIVGAGAAFDFCSGVKSQAPRWMQACGLEWLFRLCCEPRRLWKRYLIGNSLFVAYLIQDALSFKK